MASSSCADNAGGVFIFAFEHFSRGTKLSMRRFPLIVKVNLTVMMQANWSSDSPPQGGMTEWEAGKKWRERRGSNP